MRGSSHQWGRTDEQARTIATCGIETSGNPLTLAAALLARQRSKWVDPRATGAASEIAYHVKHGRPVEFSQRPAVIVEHGGRVPCEECG